MIIEFYGLRRSGIHAVLAWLQANISNSPEQQLTKEKVLFERENLYFVNEANTYCDNIMFEKLVSSGKHVILGYEDAELDFSIAKRNKHSSTKIVLLREFRNNVASRIKFQQNSNFSASSKRLHNTDEQYFKKYRSYLENVTITYEDWLFSKEARDTIMNKIGFDNIDETDKVTDFGYGSSFVGTRLDEKQNLISRFKQVEIPQQCKEYHQSLIELQQYNDLFDKYYKHSEG